MMPAPGQGLDSVAAAIAARILPALAVNLVLAYAAFRAGTVRPSGVLAGLLIGAAIWVAGGWPWFSILFLFFVLGSVLTKLGYGRKAKKGLAEADGGRRGWSHAVANTGVGTITALLWLWTGRPELAAAFAASFATAIFDTAGSEIGGLYGKTPILLPSFRRVPPGTEGAVSAEGTAGAFAASLAIAVPAALFGVVPWSLLPAVVAGAVIGGLYESLVAGKVPLGHMGLNFTNTLVGAIAAAGCAVLMKHV